jgi:cation transport protein ChaC
MTGRSGELWVFAYGSLMWRPGFAYEQAQHARLTGYRRCFCIYSVHHRGTPQRPGLVLGLDRGGSCEGIAYRIAAPQAAETQRYLRAREQVNGVYREAHVIVEPSQGATREVLALTYIVERAHPNYAGALPVALQARLIKEAKGRSGANLDYLLSTLRHLAELGIRERELERVLALAGAYATRLPHHDVASPHALALIRAARGRAPAVRREAGKAEQRRFLYRLQLGQGSTD